MMMTKWMRIAVLALIPLTAACDEDDGGGTDVDVGEDVETIRLTMGQQSVDISRGGAVSGTLTIPRGATQLTASFLRANGTTIALPSTSTFQINVTPTNTARATVARVSNFVVTVNGLQTGAVGLSVELHHGSHSEIGPHTVNATVAAATDG
jgi:hypothetical protein